MKRFILFAMVAFAAGGAFAQATSNVLGGGVCINEVLPDPNSLTFNYDTDGDGTAEDLDEFIEIYNLGGSAVDISGWELWEPTSTLTGQLMYRFPPGTMLGAGNFAVVIMDAGGMLPTLDPGNLAFDAQNGAAVGGAFPGAPITNGGDNLSLYDPGSDTYVSIIYNGGEDDDPDGIVPLETMSNFTLINGATATLAGTVEDWGFDTDGSSLTRFPAGDLNVVSTHTINSNDTASPGAEAAMSLDDPDALVPTSLSFPSTAVGGSSTATLSVTNNATSTMNLNVSGFAYGSGDLVFSVVGSAANSIAPGDSADITVMFSPSAAGPASAIFNLASDDTSDPVISVTLDGEGVLFTDVTDVAGARAQLDGAFVRIAGPITLSVNPDNFGAFGGNRSFTGQDATGGLLLFESESSPILGPSAGAGTTLTSVEGQVVVFFDIIEFEILNVGVEAAGAALSPEVITNASLLTGTPNDYESEFIEVQGISRQDDPNGTGMWQSGTNYMFQDGSSNMLTVRLASGRTDLAGTPLPAMGTPVNLTGVGGEFSGVGQLNPLAPSDFMAPAAADDWTMFE